MSDSANTSGDVLIAAVIDRSGSMGYCRDATVEGFNQFLADQRKEDGEAVLSLTFFDTSFEPRFVGVPLSEVPDLGSPANSYHPSGMTALCDAVGVTIKGAEGWLKKHPEFTGQVLVVVQTDGGENSSRDWHIKQPMVDGDDRDVAGLIKYKREEGWEFVFMGAGGSEWLENNFGHVVSKGSILGFENSAAGYGSAFRGLSASMMATRSTGVEFALDGVDA